MIGTALGHFRIMEKLADSGSGEVYRAEDEALRRPVALEVLSTALASDPDQRARFLNAARAAAAVTHPNLAAIHEVGESDGRVWVARELVEGVTLRSRLAGRPLPLLETLRIGEQVAEGLAAAHEKGLAHGDLNPGKVLLGPGGQVKVVELGRAAATADPRDDVHRLGAMLYEMATGETPRIIAGTEGAAATATTLPPSSINQEAPAELDRIIVTCLEPDPADRYQDTGAIATDLARLRRRTETAPVVARTGAGSTGKAARGAWRARSVALWSSATLVVVLALGLAGWRWIRPLLDPGPAFKNGDRIVIADFVNETTDLELGVAIQDGFEAYLATRLSGLLDIVSRVKEKTPSALDAAGASAHCLQGGCEGYLTGRVSGDTDGYVLEAALHRVGSKVPVIVSSTQADASTLGNANRSLMNEIALKLGRAIGHDITTPPECPTSSGDANSIKSRRAELRGAYVGVENPAEVIAHMKHAVELDPGDALRQFNLGLNLLDRMGRRREAMPVFKESWRLYAAKAEAHPEIVDCRGGVLMAEIYYLTCSWDHDTLAERLSRYTQLMPDEPFGWGYYAGFMEDIMGDPAAALPAARKVYELTTGGFTYLADYLMRSGDMAAVDALVEDFRSKPDSLIQGSKNFYIATVRIDQAYYRGDDYESILTLVDRYVADGDVPETWARPWRARLLASLGRLKESEQVAREAALATGVTAARAGGSARRGYGLLDWLEKRRTGAVRVLEPAELDSYLVTYISLAKAARHSIDLATVSPLAEVLHTVEAEQMGSRSRLVRDATRFMRGCMQLHRGRAKEAVALLEPLGREHGPRTYIAPQHQLGRALEGVHRWADAAQAYEAVLQQRSLAPMFPPLFVLEQHRLAGIYERLGNVERARYWYGRFLSDWRNADPGTPEVEDAKRRLATLGGQLAEAAS